MKYDLSLDHLVDTLGTWGHLPATEEVFDIFQNIQLSLEPKNVLEIGFHLGHSTTYQLELFKSAKITSISPKYGDGPVKNIADWTAEIRQKQYEKMKDKYGDRFNWIPKKSRDALEESRNCGPFDFAFIDGCHSFENTKIDLALCETLNIKNVVIDNLEKQDVYLAVKRSEWKMHSMVAYIDDDHANVMGFLSL